MAEFNGCVNLHATSKHKHSRTIIHIDIDCFYAQVEMLKNPELATKPVGIKQQHYVITSNYAAREYGITKCMPITEALALCPKLVLINGEDLHDYRIMSSKVSHAVRQFSPKVEKLGLDENFVDVSDLVENNYPISNKNINISGNVYMDKIEDYCTCGCRERLIVGSHIANEIRIKIKDELGMTASAGIGHNKLLAKLVGATHKPNQQTTVFPCMAMKLVTNLSHISAVPGIGRKTTGILNCLGIFSISDAQNYTISNMEKQLGKAQTLWIKGACFGVDDSEVKISGKQQVIGIEEATKQISSVKNVQYRMISLIKRGMILLQEDGRYPTVIRVSVRKYNRCDKYSKQRESKQSPIDPSTFKSSASQDYLFNLAFSLFKKLVDCNKPFHLTLLGLSFTKFLENSPENCSIFKFFRLHDCDTLKNATIHSGEGNIENVSTSKNRSTFGDSEISILDKLPEDIQHEILSTYPKPSTSSCLQIPAGIDIQVFSELPHEIQQELVHSYNKTIPNSKNSSKKQTSILKYLKK